jgi:hypothetical protein
MRDLHLHALSCEQFLHQFTANFRSTEGQRPVGFLTCFRREALTAVSLIPTRSAGCYEVPLWEAPQIFTLSLSGKSCSSVTVRRTEINVSRAPRPGIRVDSEIYACGTTLKRGSASLRCNHEDPAEGGRVHVDETTRSAILRFSVITILELRASMRTACI